MKIKDMVKLFLIVILGLNFLISLLFVTINSEAYFFGNKLGGINAAFYLLINSSIGIIVAYILLKKEGKGVYFSILFFGYNFIETLFTNMYSFNIYTISPLFSIGLILSVVLMVIYRSCDNRVAALTTTKSSSAATLPLVIPCQGRGMRRWSLVRR